MGRLQRLRPLSHEPPGLIMATAGSPCSHSVCRGPTLCEPPLWDSSAPAGRRKKQPLGSLTLIGASLITATESAAAFASLCSFLAELSGEEEGEGEDCWCTNPEDFPKTKKLEKLGDSILVCYGNWEQNVTEYTGYIYIYFDILCHCAKSSHTQNFH